MKIMLVRFKSAAPTVNLIRSRDRNVTNIYIKPIKHETTFDINLIKTIAPI
jgi:hypothetical protein